MYDSRDTGHGSILVDLSGRTIEEIATRTADIVIRRMEGAKDAQKSELLLSTRKAAEMLGISVSALRRRVAEFPHVNLRGRYYFRREDLRAIIESGNLVNTCDNGKE